MNKGNDLTQKYANMIQSFEFDITLAYEAENDPISFSPERLCKNKALLEYINLLQELSFGIRYGKIKIIEIE